MNCITPHVQLTYCSPNLDNDTRKASLQKTNLIDTDDAIKRPRNI